MGDCAFSASPRVKEADKFRLSRTCYLQPGKSLSSNVTGDPDPLLTLEALCAACATSPIFPGALCVPLPFSL
jgi:hypothetical protein